MINAAHLLWIIPLCVVVGYAVCAILMMGKEADERMDDIMRREKVVTVVTTKDSDENGTVTITGTDQYGNEVVEIVDMNQTLEELLKEKFGRDIPVQYILIQREDEEK